MKRILIIIFGLVALLLVGAAVAFWYFGGSNIPPEPLAALRNANTYELLSLEPTEPTPPTPDEFYSWSVLGRTTITDPETRDELTDALRWGARRNFGTVAGCFWPRHGIRVTRGETTFDFVICFECLQVGVYENGKPSHSFLVTESPQPVFDEVLRKANVQLANP
jgi:hypothetical protein